VSARDLLDFVWIVPLLPLSGAALLLLGGRRVGEPIAGWIASALMGLAFVWSVVMFFALHALPTEARSHVTSVFTWLPAGGLQVKFGLLADPLSITFILFVTGVGALIHVFAVGYMHGDARFSRFFGYMNLFCFSMLMLVLGSSFLVTFLGWEGVGLCSYLLISFWFERHNAAVAGKKAFVTTRIGDVGFMIAMFLIFDKLGSLDYSVMSTGAPHLSNAAATAIALLLFLGAIGKSAQLPLHVWLPDAMEGPTPVSALIHAATMVTAGVFLIARAHPFFVASSNASTVVAWVGVLTALLAATVGLVQPDVKRVLAYSTISQLGFMFVALGVGAYGAAIFHVVTHAFFKATLFLGAGSVIHGNGDNQDMRIMGGFRRFLPFTALASVAAWLAIAGVPPFSGFWSKDEILTRAFLAHHQHAWAWGVWIIGVIAAGLTGFYMTRQVFLVFFGNERFQEQAHPMPVVSGGSDDVHAPATAVDDGGAWDPHEPTVEYGTPPRTPALHGHPPHEAPLTMTAPVLVLGLLAAIGGLLSIPLHGLETLVAWLEPVFKDAPELAGPSFWEGVGLTAVSVLFGAAGLLLGVRLYRNGIASPDAEPQLERLGRFRDVFGHAYYFDDTVTRVVGGPGRESASWLAGTFDARGVDGIIDGIGLTVARAARLVRRAQNGLVRVYAAAVVLGAAGLLLYFLVWGR
jgi:NADH-quinone oxidoreductase subunit L